MTGVVITIQIAGSVPEITPHQVPGPVIIGGQVAGDPALGTAALRMGYGGAFGSDFSVPRGTFTVTAPTFPPDSNSGVWFFESISGIAPSLHDLPVLPSGWHYEGWLIERTDTVQVRYYSTGRFLRPDSADLDGPGPGAGPGQGLDFPGQDFITGANGGPERPNINLGPYDIMVTIEPEPDDSPAPFFLQILSSINSAGRPVGSHAPRLLYNVVADHSPSAAMEVRR
jgi:hypothetical protein